MTLRYMGGWLITKETQNKKIWKIYLFIMNFFFAFAINLLQILHLFELSSLITLASSGYLCAIACLSSVKAYYIFTYKKYFLLLIEYMQEKTFLPNNPEEEALAMKALNLHRKTKIVLALLCTFSIIGSIATPIVGYKERRLIFSAWYPFDLLSTYVYVLVFIHQIVAVLFISYMNIYGDVVVAGFTTFVGIQCDLLCYKLINMSEDRLEIGLRECINHHRLIIR